MSIWDSFKNKWINKDTKFLIGKSNVNELNNEFNNKILEKNNNFNNKHNINIDNSVTDYCYNFITIFNK